MPIPDPPAQLMTGVGAPEEFRSCGLEFFEYFKDLARLRPGERVLDIGCGPGRMAVPLAEKISGISYDGFDVVRPAIEWCQNTISTAHPEFRFKWIDVRNGTYHANGRQDPSTFRFPYEDGTFDLAIMISILTHLPSAASRNYLMETARVLKPEGRLFSTLFLMDDRAIAGVKAGTSMFRFVAHEPSFWTVNPGRPEDAVALEPDLLLKLLAEAGLSIQAKVRGKWSGSPGLTGHDLIVVKKSLAARDGLAPSPSV